ncbi:MAG: NAD-dependent epimerase/dehydratase family protein [Thermoleophilia bacterium]
MRIFVAGATGALGRRLVPLLVAGGHEVVGTTRSPARREAVEELGATAFVMDALDPDAVAAAVAAAQPEVVVHQLTAIPRELDMKHFERSFAATNRLRTEGTDNLLAAARAVGARRFVAQSFAPAIYARTGGPVKSEDDPLDDRPPAQARSTVAALRHLEDAVTGSTRPEGVVLRYGGFYGPGTNLGDGPEGTMTEAIRNGKVPLVGTGAGVWSFIHIDDAAEATVAAIEVGRPGIYNVVDDEPAPVAEWLPAAAAAAGGRAPRRVPRWLARMFAGEFGVIQMTEARGASNRKARQELGWRPLHASWRQGFAESLG